RERYAPQLTHAAQLAAGSECGQVAGVFSMQAPFTARAVVTGLLPLAAVPVLIAGAAAQVPGMLPALGAFPFLFGGWYGVSLWRGMRRHVWCYAFAGGFMLLDDPPAGGALVPWGQVTDVTPVWTEVYSPEHHRHDHAGVSHHRPDHRRLREAAGSGCLSGTMARVDSELRAELLERAGRDQAARTSLPSGRLMAEWETAVAPVDRDNTARLREIIGQHGWPGDRLVGADGAHAAWLLAQHAPEDLQEECLPLLEDAVARGDASPADLAYLTDRVLMNRGEPQLHGTQYRRVRDGPLELWPVRDPAGLDARRAALGLAPEAVYRARLLAAEGPAVEHQDD
ncbi:MAG: DUF6624 domain-containing protein, partial [Streptosporangiaceae bacterium]